MILSICIPTYNRFSELRKNLESICKSSSYDFNVYVVDNCSDRDIYILDKKDERIHFIKRNHAVPACVNGRTCLDYADGEYVMICLDKDFIDGECLTNFVNELKKTSVTCGYCKLNSEELNGVFLVNKNSISSSIYQGRHPSGIFFRRDYILESEKNMPPFDEKSVFYNNPFCSDFIYAYGLISGFEGVYTGKLITTESPEKASKVLSYTYLQKNNNIFFMPKSRREQFLIYIKHLECTRLSDKTKRKIICSLFFRTLSKCTLEFREIMMNKAICIHYGINPENVPISSMVHEAKLLSSMFVNTNINYLGMIRKKVIVYYSVLRIILRLLKYNFFIRN